MTHAEAMQFWFGRVNFEQTPPQVGDFKLDRMRALLRLLGDPQEGYRIVHIAGSKGKGSTAAFLAAVLQAAGYRTGLFTSPHLVAVEERIQVDRAPISPDELATLMAEIRAAAAGSLERELTFFEIGTALGFLHFARRRADLAVVEVGLGGRFDSTNVCRPAVSVITSISFDHTQMLGDTLAQIAREKAGIVKPGRPVVSGVRNPEARRVIEDTCAERHAPLRELDRDFRYTHEPAVINGQTERWPSAAVTTWRQRWPDLRLGLIGDHQAANAAVAVATVELLREQGLPVTDSAVRQGLAGVTWPARLEVLGKRPLVLLDCAHNVASAHALVKALLASFPLATPSARRLLIFAASRDKDLPGMLAALAPAFDRMILTRFRSARCVPPEQVLPLLPEPLRTTARLCETVPEAWEEARREARPDDVICAAGSVFLAGELRPVMMGARRASEE